MINKIVCNAEDLTAIADAVRASSGSTNTYNVPELSAAAVNAIGTGGVGVSIDDTLTVSGAAADAKATGDRFAELTSPPETTTGRIVQVATEESSSVVVESDAEVCHTGRNLFVVGNSVDDFVKKAYLLSVNPTEQTMHMKMTADSYSHAVSGNKIPFTSGMSISIAAECVGVDANPLVPVLSVKSADGTDLTSGVNGRHNSAYGGFIPSNFGDNPAPSSYTFVCSDETASYCCIGVALRTNRGIEVGTAIDIRIMAEVGESVGNWEAGFRRKYMPVGGFTEIQTVQGVNNVYASDQSEIAILEGTSPLVQSVNGKRGMVLLTAKDVGAVRDTVAVETVYSTVKDMLEDAALAVGKRARTLGYYAADDGGGARYTVDADNAGYGLACVNGYCNIVGQSRMSPKMFGAIGNGDYEKTNDTEAFQACMDFCAGRYIVDVSDGCYVIAGVKLYHGKVYDIVGSHRQGLDLVAHNKKPGTILVKHGAEYGFIGDDALGANGTTGLPNLVLNLYGIRASGFYHTSMSGFPTFIKGVTLSMSRIDNVVVSNMGCFIDGIMKSACEVSNCYITVSDAAFRSRYIVNGEYHNGFVDCYFYSNLFMGIMNFGNGQLFKPVVFDAWGFYTIQFSDNFAGGMWAIVGYRRIPGSDAVNGEIVGWSSHDNIYSYVKEFATAKDDAEYVVVGNFKSYSDQIWHCSHASLTNTTEGRSYFDDLSGNTRITGDKTPFFSLWRINIGTIRDLGVRFCDPVFPDSMSLRQVTINRPVYMVEPYGSDYAESEILFDTKFPIADFEAGRDTRYKYTRIEPWNDRVVDTLPVIQDANYRYVLEGQTCYYNNKLLTCRGDSWYDAMGNAVTA